MAHQCRYCDVPLQKLTDTLDALKKRVDGMSIRISRTVHRFMVLDKGGSVKWLDPTCQWIHLTEREDLLVIPAEVLQTASAPRSSLPRTSKVRTKTTVPNASTAIKESYILDMLAEVIINILRQLDLDDDAYGRAGLPLTCKQLARTSKLVKVNKTKRLVKHLGWLGHGAWCDGCDKVKSLRKEYWDETMPRIMTQWLPTSIYVPWESTFYTLCIGAFDRWVSTRDEPEELPRWCPECVAQWFWEQRNVQFFAQAEYSMTPHIRILMNEQYRVHRCLVARGVDAKLTLLC